MKTLSVISDFNSIKNNWQDLWTKITPKLPFTTWEWQNIWWQNGGQGELNNFLIQKNQDLIGIGSFRLENNIVRWSTNEEITDYQDILSLPKNNYFVWKEILNYYQSKKIKGIELRNIPQNSLSLVNLKRLSLENKFLFEEKIEDVVPFIGLPKDFDSYLQSLNRKNRHELKRKVRRFESESEGKYQLIKSEAKNHQTDCTYFFKLFRQSNLQKREFLTPLMERFFCQVTQSMRDLNLLDFSSLIYQDKIISQTISFISEDKIMLYNMASDTNYYHLSPGLIINKLLIEESIQKGLTFYDFLQGNERYKYQLGAIDNFVSKITLTL